MEKSQPQAMMPFVSMVGMIIEYGDIFPKYRENSMGYIYLMMETVIK